MSRSLESEVAKGVRSQSVHVRYETGIGVVLDVFTFNEVLHAVERAALAMLELYDVSLEEINLKRERG